MNNYVGVLDFKVHKRKASYCMLFTCQSSITVATTTFHKANALSFLLEIILIALSYHKMNWLQKVKRLLFQFWSIEIHLIFACAKPRHLWFEFLALATHWITYDTWDLFLKNPVDARETCPGQNGNITQYKISFQTESLVKTETINITSCTAGQCSHTF